MSTDLARTPNASFADGGMSLERAGSRSALRSPRAASQGGAKGGVRFDPTSPSMNASQNNNASSIGGKATNRSSTASGGMTPLKQLAPTVGTISEQIALLHAMILEADFAPLVKKSCHIHLFDADRAISAHCARRSSQSASTPRSGGAASVSQTQATTTQPQGRTTTDTAAGRAGGTGRASSAAAAAAGAAAAAPTAGDEGESSPGSDFGGGNSARRAARQAKMERSWRRFVKAVEGQLSEEEVELLSLNTVKQLMRHFGIDRDPVDTANIELYWRVIAQRREDQRNKSAIMHKSCAAASEPKKHRATRDLSASFDKRSDKRR